MDLCFQARAWYYKGITHDYVAEARALYERALALDPANVWALLGIATMDMIVAVIFYPDDRAARFAAAETAATKAVSLAPENAFAHMCLGFVQIYTSRASQGIRECERALELDRNLADAHGHIGGAKILLGQAEDTEAHIREALRLSPHDTFVYGWCVFAGSAKLSLGREEEAIAWLRRSVESNRNYPTSHLLLAAGLAHLGRLTEARSEAQVGLAMIPTFTISRFLASAPSDNPAFRAGRERYIDGLRKAGVPEE